jgi:F-type H+-transporting ATPase subunit delta
MALKSQASRRYATALLGTVINGKTLSLDEALGQLGRFNEAVRGNFDLKNALLNPAFTREERDRVVDTVIAHLQLAPTIRSFLKILVDTKRIAELDAITDSFRAQADQHRGRTRAVVHSAAPLAADQADRLRRALEKAAGRSIELEVHVDPSLIGGVRAHVGSMVFDGTIRSELDRLRPQLAFGE